LAAARFFGFRQPFGFRYFFRFRGRPDMAAFGLAGSPARARGGSRRPGRGERDREDGDEDGERRPDM
jgi:hypothetical protein